jgi:hypothetical protein
VHVRSASTQRKLPLSMIHGRVWGLFLGGVLGEWLLLSVPTENWSSAMCNCGFPSAATLRGVVTDPHHTHTPFYCASRMM